MAEHIFRHMQSLKCTGVGKALLLTETTAAASNTPNGVCAGRCVSERVCTGSLIVRLAQTEAMSVRAALATVHEAYAHVREQGVHVHARTGCDDGVDEQADMNFTRLITHSSIHSLFVCHLQLSPVHKHTV